MTRAYRDPDEIHEEMREELENLRAGYERLCGIIRSIQKFYGDSTESLSREDAMLVWEIEQTPIRRRDIEP